LEHRASNPVSVKNLTDIENSTTVKLLRPQLLSPYVPVGKKKKKKKKKKKMMMMMMMTTMMIRIVMNFGVP
jgi:accessory gene regulator protein AgrB